MKRPLVKVILRINKIKLSMPTELTRSKSPKPIKARRTKGSGQTPMMMQDAAKNIMEEVMEVPASVADAAFSERGSPRKTTPTNLVKQAMARPPITAREIMDVDYLMEMIQKLNPSVETLRK